MLMAKEKTNQEESDDQEDHQEDPGTEETDQDHKEP